ncbi:unnamed protein product [Orchesella dallaii]|uniref:Uncharacterized protein n=1 Tax=Orchesella dallaii TaxID=48710 RepID=A0ABP1PHJ9_9HEXA
MLSLIVFSFIYLIGFATAKEYHTNGLVLDVTEPINDILNGKSEEKDLINNLNALFSFNGADFTNRTLYFAADGKTIAEMENQTLQFYNIVKNTIGITSEKFVLVSWTVNITTLGSLKYPSYLETLIKRKPAIIINLPDETECNQELDSKFWYSLLGGPNGTIIPDGFIGISISESLIQCDFARNVRVTSKIVVVKIKFGNTIGVQESYGLFQNRFKFLSDSTTSVLRKLWLELSHQKIVYFPTPDCVGDNNHRELLMKYASIWASSNKTYGDIIVQGYTAINEPRNFSITPSIAIPGAVYMRNTFSWFPLMIAAGFQKQQSFILNDRQWRLYIREIENLHENSPVPSSLALPLDLILDYTDLIKLGIRSSNSYIWELEEKSMMRSISLGLINNTGVKLSTIVFLLNTKCFTNESCEFTNDKNLVEFAQKMKASNVVIGCVFLSESFEQIEPPAVVNACNEINGTLYIIRMAIFLSGNQDGSTYSFQYENTVRMKLEKAFEIRNLILKKQPLAKVQLELTVKGDESQGKYFVDVNSLFCDEVLNEINLYLEAIINWGNLRNFPIILKRNSPKRYYYSIYHILFPMLRQLNNPYFEWSLQGQEEKNETEFQLNKATDGTHPSFLTHNYLKSNFKWEMDTCINWEEGKAVLKNVDFYTNYVGIIFHADDMVVNRTASLEEYIIQLQFIFHRFQLAEIVVGTDFRKVIDGISLAIKVLKISTPTIFVCYVPSNENPYTELRNFQSLLASVTGKASQGSEVLSGIHVELSHTRIDLHDKVVFNITNGDSVLALLNVIKQSSLKAGILASVEVCGEIIKNTISSKDNLYAELLKIADYLICKEENEFLLKEGKRLYYELILDTHLFIKRLANVLFPHLVVNFRVELSVEINTDRTAMQKYLNLVDLFKTFGSAYDINYFIVEAFDNQLREEKTGWWEIANFTDLTNPKSYVEKLLVYNGQIMWYPPTTEKPSNFSTTNVSQNTIISFASLAVIFVLIALVIAVVVRYRKLQQILSDEEVKDFLNGKALGNTEMGTEEAGDLKYMKFNPDHNLDFSDICIGNPRL